MPTRQQWLDRFNAMSMLELAEIWECHLEYLHPDTLAQDFTNFRLEQSVMAAELADLMINGRPA